MHEAVTAHTAVTAVPCIQCEYENFVGLQLAFLFNTFSKNIYVKWKPPGAFSFACHNHSILGIF